MLLHALLWLGLAFPALDSTAADERIERLLSQVRERRDYTRKETFDELAKPGDEASFEALATAIGWLSHRYTLEDAYEAMRFFRSNGVLTPRVTEFLAAKALRGPKDARVYAVDALRFFGDRGREAMLLVLRESKEEDIQGRATYYALDKLLESGEESSLRLVLEHADPADVAKREQPFRAFDPDVARPWLLKNLQDRRTSVGWALVLIPALEGDPGEDVVEALCALLRHKSSALVVAALDELVRRGEETQARVQLERLRHSAVPEVRVAVVRIQTRLSKSDPTWRTTLSTLAGAHEAGDRIAAAAGLGVLGDADACRKLEQLLRDKSWKVRHAALDVAGELHRKELLAPVIARLTEEDGAMRVAVANTLEHLTGLKHGENARAWTRWYEEQGATFELPSAEEIAALEAKRDAPPAPDETVAAFYGLPVRSKNVCFAIDMSTSMQEKVDADRTRFDVAKEELERLLDRLPPECRCNLVFFEDKVVSWQKRLRPMDAKARAEAQAFVRAREMEYGTNIYGALAEAFADDSVDTVYLLSDGDPSSGKITDPLELRAELGLWNSVARVTVFCVSVGQESLLLRELAHDSGGIYLEVGVEKDGK